jgi:hypothetical protein
VRTPRFAGHAPRSRASDASRRGTCLRHARLGLSTCAGVHQWRLEGKDPGEHGAIFDRIARVEIDTREVAHDRGSDDVAILDASAPVLVHRDEERPLLGHDHVDRDRLRHPREDEERADCEQKRQQKSAFRPLEQSFAGPVVLLVWVVRHDFAFSSVFYS